MECIIAIMRIHGNRVLKTLPGQQTRPTSARVREALFNIWQGKLHGARCLDLCAGNGTIGAEALCRGSAYLVGIEKNRRACQLIKQNWQSIATHEQTFQIIQGDIRNKIKDLQGQQFDFIYFDPPYGANLYDTVLMTIPQFKLLAPQGEIAVEHDPKQWNHQQLPNLNCYRQKKYGNTYLSFWELIS